MQVSIIHIYKSCIRNLDLEEQNEWLKYKHWWLICTECAWCAPFGSSYKLDRKHPRPNDTQCHTCNTELLWIGLSHEIDLLFYTSRREDPEYTMRCGNGLSGFTSKLAVASIYDQNNIEWWLK